MTRLSSIFAATRIAVLGIPSRMAMSAAAVLSIALAVLVLLGFLSMATGFRAATQSGGSEDVAVILADGASSEMNSAIDLQQFAPFETAPEILRTSHGPVISYEAHEIVSAVKEGGSEANVTLRGTRTRIRERRRHTRHPGPRRASAGAPGEGAHVHPRHQ